MSDEIELSVVVTVVDGGATLDRCLAALAGQHQPPPMEVLVPWDASLPDPAPVAARFPGARFIPMGPVATERPADSPAGQHELFDRRRAAGLGEARGRYVAILEDRGAPRPDWARVMVAHHLSHSRAAIGGAIENASASLVSWAVYFCDFGRYQLPFRPGPRPYVSDVNICYRREALEQTRELWAGGYHETRVNWALRRAGQELWLTPDAVVEQERRGLRLGPLLAERRHWGRLFAVTRVAEGGFSRRVLYAVGSVALPVVLLARIGAGVVGRRRAVGPFVLALPIIALLLAGWSLGELQGYLTARR